ncbi:hypothetical protein SLEP1_g42080 [Rubroshorea leprosula]|uniref:Rho GTPase-activating protein REN1-like n=1 Tax=Rubroshorea leprosula TaxID=152421 RepID=A0AAV5L9I4_9ROSI|nr:hypothetical protein SLEP1_g42080 [Rubroshorea leprosula]
MATKKEEPSLVQQGEAADPHSPPPPGPEPAPPDQQRSRGGNKVFKSGPLFISSKGIGWTSWKKRWFILTQTSLVFFRSDPIGVMGTLESSYWEHLKCQLFKTPSQPSLSPLIASACSAAPQKAGEVNLTLGGIDLNNSGSVVVKADKKLLTVLLGEGRDGRAFTLKAETSEDLYEWKTALETALAQAPNPAHVTGQNGIFRNDQVDAFDGSKELSKDKPATRFTVRGTPILLALQDVDGGPTFLEKALRFVEDYGIKVEGILRQAADVDDVEQRIREYEQGKTEFSPEEDAHVIADCVKYVLRELPSSPVPASCCKALLEACRTDRANRVNAMRGAICETFPEPNRRLLQRILMMMQTVASHMDENRMSPSAVAACMAPLLLRPLLHGDCEIENDFDVGGDGSMQLLQAAAAANHAQAIVITLLEEYKTIFGEGSMSPDLYSDSDESGSEGEEATDDESYVDDEDDESYIDDEDYENDDASEGSEEYTDDDIENASSRTGSETENDVNDEKESGDSSRDLESPTDDDLKASQKLPSNSIQVSLPVDDHTQRSENRNQSNSVSRKQTDESAGRSKDAETAFMDKPTTHVATSCTQKMTTAANGPTQSHSRKRPTSWGRTSAKKNLSMESIDFDVEEDEYEIKRLEDTKADLQNRIAEEVKGNESLQARLEERKRTLRDRRLALEKDVARLHEQLHKERDKRKALRAGLDSSQRPLSIPSAIDEKTRTELKEIVNAEADVNNLNQKVEDLSLLLNQREQTFISMHDSSDQPQQISNQPKGKIKQKETEAAGSSLFGRSKSKVQQLLTIPSLFGLSNLFL